MKESIRVNNDNGFNVGLMCYDWHKTREVPPKGFIWLNEKEVLEIDGSTPYFKDGTLVIQDDEINETLGYKEKNPNSVTEVEILEIFKMQNLKMRKELEKITEDFAKLKIYEAAKKVDLSASKIKIVEDIVGRKIEFEHIDEKEVD